ncbi:hypothetical protein LOZ53_002537 [Ophidiomyces ophidiicola]|uniref:Uncharacterized protein n=1 Tax=Ophidiomyces ophidiicola TaxID=1387563 RepID=A0ACB8UXX5_9EURO|nr:uncharacterized protein LOZ57_002189 [Ophidiomyces ophidiicola]KAI1913883.1 hypothetical protein LOZ61_002538 [Ophidiomyces ophidiicola]KAI1916786.1 hypothetical protein LOZ64_003247 [Ophidiomyces ophidiicola]KAI1927878.1 hypothetical protein LOZ60_002708 [Ophidiomyces ophidiicola]KAI1948006.1 hypothetical protein LOZ62_002866 [Ophidiomyces ophidiicola]KAI1949714.1 hypothetical protein LOZ57_002189 [Ophidiomyces ophidiicola]
MDSPAVTAPLDPQEQPILDQLLLVRDALLLLKQDKSTYIKSQDVLPFYDRVIEQVQLLNSIRSGRVEKKEHNRVDNVLDDCFQLISLLFLTVGRNNEAPATYSMASTIKRLLDHLKEASFYSQKDLDSIAKTLRKMGETVDRGKETYSPHLLTLLQARLDNCEKQLADLQHEISLLSPELNSTHETLISILRSTAAANTRSKFSFSEVSGFKDRLIEIKGNMKDGKFVALDGSVPEGQEIVKVLLERCLIWVDIVLERQGNIDERFKERYDHLVDIRNQLDRLAMTQAWSLRETDLYMFQRKLNQIDACRINGNFLDATGRPADLHAQRTLLYLIRRSYALIYGLLISSEPVSEALLPIYNQLQTLRKCLMEVKESGGVSNSRELYPYSMKLNSIDNMRVEGKFYIGADLPEGQGSVNELLAQCYDLCYELRAAAEEEGSAERDII